MAMRKQVLDKIARNLGILGLQSAVTRGSAGEVIVENGSADVTISYADASFSPSMMGGVDGTVSPFLGIGIGNPGKITITVAAADSLDEALQTAIAIRCFAVCAAFANDIQLLSSADASVMLQVRGHSDLIGMGE